MKSLRNISIAKEGEYGNIHNLLPFRSVEGDIASL